VIGVIIDITPIEERTTAYGKSDIMSLYLRNERLKTIFNLFFSCIAIVSHQYINKVLQLGMF
jgi:hypothetical protein